MDIYRALNADVPQVLFTVLHQAKPTVSEEDFTRTSIALHMDIRRQMEVVNEELHQWLQRQYTQHTEETVQKLQRLAVLKADADLKQVQEALIRDYARLGSRIGTASLLGLEGSAEETYREEAPSDLDLARRFANGREYLESLGFKLGQDVLHEAWLVFRGSIHFDVIEHVMRDLLDIHQDSYNGHREHVARASFSTYNLIYQLGEALTDPIAHDTATQEVTFAFSKGPIQYSPFRQEVAGLLEYVADKVPLVHASFWQRKLGLGAGKEFMLRLRLAEGEEPLQEIINIIADSGSVGKETIVECGKLLIGRRVL